MQYIGIGLQLMVVGMFTVFLILIIVIFMGKGLIALVNRVAPAEEVAPKKQQKAATTTTVDATTMAVLQQVVAQITGGKGHIASAKRV